MKAPLPNPQDKAKGKPSWGFIIMYVVLILGMLWVLQNADQETFRTISYSEFKAYIERGEVVECSIKDTEIEGKIQPYASEVSKAPSGNACPRHKPPRQLLRNQPEPLKLIRQLNRNCNQQANQRAALQLKRLCSEQYEWTTPTWSRT